MISESEENWREQFEMKYLALNQELTKALESKRNMIKHGYKTTPFPQERFSEFIVWCGTVHELGKRELSTHSAVRAGYDFQLDAWQREFDPILKEMRRSQQTKPHNHVIGPDNTTTELKHKPTSWEGPTHPCTVTPNMIELHNKTGIWNGQSQDGKHMCNCQLLRKLAVEHMDELMRCVETKTDPPADLVLRAMVYTGKTKFKK